MTCICTLLLPAVIFLSWSCGLRNISGLLLRLSYSFLYLYTLYPYVLQFQFYYTQKVFLMFVTESRIAKVGGSEREPEQTEATARRSLKRSSTINSLTPTSVSIWDLSNPSEGEKHRITRVRLNNSAREYVKGRDHRCKIQREHFGPQGRYRCGSSLPCFIHFSLLVR